MNYRLPHNLRLAETVDVRYASPRFFGRSVGGLQSACKSSVIGKCLPMQISPNSQLESLSRDRCVPAVDFATFQDLYLEIFEIVYRHWTPAMQDRLACHCRAWGPDVFRFDEYLKKSVTRFYLAYQNLAADERAKSVCDVGGFWGVFPLTLQRLGYDVTMTEALEYYDDVFTGLFHTIQDHGVTIADCDLFRPDSHPHSKFDFVSVMAVLEHYPHSLKPFMRNVVALLNPTGSLYLEVPNIAFLPKRLSMILGKSPLAPIRDIYESETPYIGHHHEFTMRELEDLAELSDLTVKNRHYINYTHPMNDFGSLIAHPLKSLAYTFAPATRELISILCSGRAA